MPTEPLSHPSVITCTIMATLVWAIILWVGFTATRKMTTVPRGLQNFVEASYVFLRDLYMGLLGPKGARHLPVVITLFWFILISNLISVTPLRAPTANLSTSLGLALFVFMYVQYWAIRSKGVLGYLKHFLGPMIWLAPIFLIVEVVGLFAQPLSLAMRLFGNIYGEDYIAYVVYHVSPYFPAQVLVYGLIMFTGILQAFIFTMLTSAYIGIATHNEHDDDHEANDQAHRSEDAAFVPAA